MTTRELETYLHEHIPLSQAMGVSVTRAGLAGVTLSAPLAANINHRSTVFGGSASALAILAGWTLIYTRMRAEGHQHRIVIQRNSITYDRPIRADFSASAALAGPEAWDRFLAVLKRRNRARIAVQAQLRSEGEIVGKFEGEYVALL